ncbi:MAG: hypothetical protein K0U17_00245 [Betaproteobacteria bacterium]|nr:hypothetical protein [Betaproteobacteria bacterium]
MRTPSTETVVLKEEELRLVRRPDSKRWQAHFKVGESKLWIRRATGTTDLTKAKAFAERLHMKAVFDYEDGRPVQSRKFKAVATTVMDRLIKEIKAGTARPSEKDYVSAIKLYLIPYYGSYNIDKITPAIISEFHVWRKKKIGRELSASAQNNHNAAFNRVMDEAIERGYMTEYMRPATKNTGAEGDARPDFTHVELEAIIAMMPKWAQTAHMERSRWIRALLCIYVPFMAATGMRPGTEAEFVEWRHIDIEVRDGLPILHFRIQKGKRGARNFVAHNSCWLLLEKLRQLSPDLQGMTLKEVLMAKIPKLLFRLPDGTQPDSFNKPFKLFLDDNKMMQCQTTGKERSLYSLRHYYTTQRLLEGVPIADLAEQLGTSLPMIMKHYSHLSSLMKPHQFTGSVDGAKGGEQAEIKALMDAAVFNNNVLSMIEQSTGLSLQLVMQSVAMKDDFTHRLRSKQSSPT